MRRSIGILSGVVMLGLTCSALAIPLPVGDPVPDNSWIQPFGDDGCYGGGRYSFSRLEAFCFDGAGFEVESESPEGFNSFNNNDWYGKTYNKTYAEASGCEVTNLSWNFHFGGNWDQKFSFDYFAYDKLDNVIGSFGISWDGNGAWDCGATFLDRKDYDGYVPDNSVPDGGSTVVLLGAALSILGLRSRRR